MSVLQRNIFANYIGQFYVTLCSFLFLPLFLKYLGAEAYGLVGFFAVLQQWFMLLDMGLSPTLSREVSRYGSGAVKAVDLASLVRTVEWIFVLLMVVCCVAAWFLSPFLAKHWLSFDGLPEQDVILCLRLAGLMFSMRWLSGLYRSGVVGVERHGVLNLSAVVFVTIRTFGALAVFEFWRADVVYYFLFQAVISFFETFTMYLMFYRFIPMKNAGWMGSARSLGAVRRLTGLMMYMTLLWTVISQTDKLLLSHFLPLTEFGYFSSAATLAGAVTLLSGPLIQALQPRLASLSAGGDMTGLLDLFRLGLQLISSVVFSAAGIMFFFGSSLLLAWTHNAELASSMGRVLGLFSAGNALVAILGLVFQLQFAHGIMRPHAWGSTLFAVFWIPSIPWCAIHFGAQGVAATWLIANACFLFVWTPFSLKRIFPELGTAWLMEDIVVTAGICLTLSAVLSMTHVSAVGYAGLLVFLSFGGFVLFLSLVTRGRTRRFMSKQIYAVMRRVE